MCDYGQVLCLTLEMFPTLHRDGYLIFSLRDSDSSEFTCHNANPFQFASCYSLCSFEFVRRDGHH